MIFAGFALAGHWNRHPATGTWFGWSDPYSRNEGWRPMAFMLSRGDVEATFVEQLVRPMDKNIDLPRPLILGGDMPALLIDWYRFATFDSVNFRRPADMN
jgi:hypothetical protein